MKFETVFAGVRIPDSYGILFQLDVCSERWRFASDIVYVVFQIETFTNRPIFENIHLKINLPLKIFEDNLTSYKEVITPNGIKLNFEMKRDYLICYVKEFMYMKSLAMGIIDEKGADPNTDTLDSIVIDYGDVLGKLYDPQNKLIGIVCDKDIEYPTAKEYFTLEKGENVTKQFDRNAPFYSKINKVLNIVPQKTEHYLSAVLLTKGENEYLMEFLQGNKKAGIDFFYIYDNNKDEKDYVENIIKGTEFESICKVIHFQKQRQLQYEAYAHFMKNFKFETTWATFIDTDEIYEGDLRSYCKEHENKYIDLGILWTIHNANGHIEKPKGAQAENYTKVVPYGYGGVLGKIIIQPDKVKKMYVHSCVYHPVYERYYPYEEIVDKKFIPNGKIKLHHYICRSLEEWIDKIKRGSCDAFYVRRAYLDFVHYNPELEQQTQEYLKKHGIPLEFKQIG